MIKRHYDKIAMWQTLLAELGWAKSPAQGPTPPSGIPNGGQATPTTPQPPGNMVSPLQQQMQQQQQLQQQQQQQMQQHQQQMHQQMQQQMQQQVRSY